MMCNAERGAPSLSRQTHWRLSLARRGPIRSGPREIHAARHEPRRRARLEMPLAAETRCGRNATLSGCRRGSPARARAHPTVCTALCNYRLDPETRGALAVAPLPRGAERPRSVLHAGLATPRRRGSPGPAAAPRGLRGVQVRRRLIPWAEQGHVPDFTGVDIDVDVIRVDRHLGIGEPCLPAPF